MNDFTSSSTFFRIYYPSSFNKTENDPSKWIKWSPNEKYIESLAGVVTNWTTAVKWVIWLLGGEPMVPAMWEVPPSSKKMPVILFSHGFGATRFISSTVAVELASHGYFVASIEHKDTSANMTYYYEDEAARDNDTPTYIEHIKMTFPPNHYEIRNEQLHKRVDEMKKILDILEDLNRGEVTNVLPSTFDLQLFKGLLDLNSVCISGHSFGGATSLLTMQTDDRISCGVILDGWMFPLKDECIEIDKPLLFINTRTFHTEPNLKVMQNIINLFPKDKELYTIKNTTHETQTDMPHIIGYWQNLTMPKLKPEVGTKINNNLILKFLSQHLKLPLSDEECRAYLEQEKDKYVEGGLPYPEQKPKL
ncbi:platelet-activating factor acetylhydrolase-like isoform X2 [Cimex lectularius]|nr:platelet-activating factor acetylhydrolase-like isoform X2 [Cimex lectularius]XP_014258507.1 platelet-activating factor acetylhydrolase-like isoform X2 [Cimex lectularius]